MSVVVAIVRFTLGFAAAALTAGAVQALFVAGADGLALARLESLGLLTLLAATQSAVFALPFAALAALVAAWLPIRSRLYFVACGILIALAGFSAQYVSEAGAQTIYNSYALAAYVASGLAAGLMYVLVAVPKNQASGV
ncbi:hypothetical protein [Hyphomicrobium sp.]|uniref:hypothetical protein n=1 Tax=Hyphomicrobium sp. TaxID=82 RepID=UPI003F6F8D53